MYHSSFNQFPLGDINQVSVLKISMSPLYSFTLSSLGIITRSRISGSKYSNCLEICGLVLPIDWLIDLFSGWPPHVKHGLWSEKYLASYIGSGNYQLCDLWHSSNLPEPAFFDNLMNGLRESTQHCVWHIIRFLSNIDSFSIIFFHFHVFWSLRLPVL